MLLAFPGNRQCGDAERTGLQQGGRARDQGGTGRHHVVDQDDPTAIQRPISLSAGGQPERSRDITGPSRSIEVELALGWTMSLEELRARKAGVAGSYLGQQDGLVVAAFAGTVGVDRDRDQHVSARPGMSPAGRQRGSQWFREAPFAGVLQGMERSSHWTDERAAPLELEQRSWDLGEQTDRDPARSL